MLGLGSPKWEPRFMWSPSRVDVSAWHPLQGSEVSWEGGGLGERMVGPQELPNQWGRLCLLGPFTRTHTSVGSGAGLCCEHCWQRCAKESM